MLRTTTNLVVELIPDGSGSFAFVPDPFLILVLNRQLTGVLQLCLQSDPTELLRIIGVSPDDLDFSVDLPSDDGGQLARLKSALGRLMELRLLERVTT